MNQKIKMRFAIFIIILCFIGIMIVHLSPTADSKRESSTQIETGLLNTMVLVTAYYFSIKIEPKPEGTTEKTIELKQTTTESKKDEA